MDETWSVNNDFLFFNICVSKLDQIGVAGEDLPLSPKPRLHRETMKKVLRSMKDEILVADVSSGSSSRTSCNRARLISR